MAKFINFQFEIEPMGRAFFSKLRKNMFEKIEEKMKIPRLDYDGLPIIEFQKIRNEMKMIHEIIFNMLTLDEFFTYLIKFGESSEAEKIIGNILKESMFETFPKDLKKFYKMVRKAVLFPTPENYKTYQKCKYK